MKKVFIILAVAAVFAACDSKKKDEGPTPVPPVQNNMTPAAGDTGKTKTHPDSGKPGQEGHGKNAGSAGGK